MSAKPQPPHDFLWEYPPALTPHLQLVIPRAREGEAGVVDYDGRWSVLAIADAAKRLAGPYAPAVPAEELSRLETQLDRLRDLLFELVFLEGSAESSEISRQGSERPSFLARLFGRASPKVAAQPKGLAENLEAKLDISGGVAVAIASCEDALREVQIKSRQHQT